MNILVVDDEKEIADVVELYLQNEYHVLKFYTGQEALECIEKTNVDLAILDVMLPDIDGFTILRKIREKYTFPVIMLTAKTEYRDKQSLPLTPTEFEILWILCENRGKVISSQRLFEEVWHEEYLKNSNNTVMVHIRHLREKLSKPTGKSDLIKTVWGVGYKIEE